MFYKTRTASVSKTMRRKRKKSNTVSPNTVYGPAANKAFYCICDKNRKTGQVSFHI